MKHLARTPRRAFILLEKKVEGRHDPQQIVLYLSPWNREAEAVGAAMKGLETVQRLIKGGGFPAVSMNTQAAFILKCCDGVTTEKEIIELYAERFSLEMADSEPEVRSCLKQFEIAGIIDYDWDPL